MFTREALLAAAEAAPRGGPLPRRFLGAAVESRAVRPGQLFIALARDAAARQRAVAAAVDAGASAILAAAPDVYAAARNVPQLIVADPLAVLRYLARDCLRRQPRTQVVAVVGGADAPATKDAVAALLAHLAPTLRMPGPPSTGEWPGAAAPLLALLSLELEHAYAVLALDASGPDGVGGSGGSGGSESAPLASLCRLLAPRIGVVAPFDPTLPSAASPRMRQASQAVRAATDLLRVLPAEGVAVLDADGRHVRSLARATTAQVVTVGRRIGADLRALRTVGELARGTRFTLAAEGRQVRVQLAIPGDRAVAVALAAAAVALRCGLQLDLVAGALSELRVPKPRAVSREPATSEVMRGALRPPAVAAAYGQSDPHLSAP